MPPRYSYWTIIAGGLPTAFRAAERDDLLPTFKRIQEKHPDAQMKWFARGKLWESPAAAREDTERRRAASGDGRRRPSGLRESRGREWRPGGEHRDPRQPFKDAKKERNQERRQRRFERSNRPPREKPHGDPLREEVRPFRSDRQPRGPAKAATEGRRQPWSGAPKTRSVRGGSGPPKRQPRGGGGGHFKGGRNTNGKKRG